MNLMREITWTLLPDSLLLKIFQLLEELDLVHASSTCTRWRRMFYEPRFWRSVTFDLNKSFQSPLGIETKLGNYLQAVGSSVRHVTIICPESGFFAQRQVTDWVKVILNTLTVSNRTIQSFHLKQLKMVCHWKNSDYTLCDLIVSLCHFIESQTCLQTLVISEALLPTTLGHLVMSSLARSPSVDTLLQLDIFLLYAHDDMGWNKKNANMIRAVFSKLKRLREITLNYTLLMDIKVEDLCTTLQHSLEKLELKGDSADEETTRLGEWEDFDYVDDDGEDDQFVVDREDRITRQSWTRAIRACPGLKVSLDMNLEYDTPDDFSLQAVPVSNLTIRGLSSGFQLNGDGINIRDFLSENLLKTLETLTLIGDSYVDEQGLMMQANPADIAKKLMRFSKLRSVQISAELMSYAQLEMVKSELRARSGIDRDILSLI